MKKKKKFSENNRNSGRILKSWFPKFEAVYYEFNSNVLRVGQILFVLFRCPTVSKVTDVTFILKWKRLLAKYSWAVLRIMIGYAFRAKENTEITSVIAASKWADLCNTNFNTYISISFDRVYRQLSASLTLLVSWCSVAVIMTEGRLLNSGRLFCSLVLLQCLLYHVTYTTAGLRHCWNIC